ncbi:MAG: bifunctional [glutamine synthetase] adenylyltransferase/[glutamine synthetase]-adenylyl-L-tyrosine phosphorylase [Pseudomonadota bacterium]
MTGGLIDRINQAPRAYDARRGDAAAAMVGVDALAPLIAGAAGSSPYLSRCLEKEAEWIASVSRDDPADALAGLKTSGDGVTATASVLRESKRRAALLIALTDLGGVWKLDDVTCALTDFADRALQAAFSAALGAERTGSLAGADAASGGLIALMMGKGGAGELNYSSDIDLILFFDDERFGDEAAEARTAWIRVTRRVVKILSEVTAEGYVFRTDLRLRPNPAVTPVCMPASAAERYYEGEGRTWERSAFIKARAAAGDIEAGEAFLSALEPFIWRRHLDFAALEDINDIRAKIRDAKGLGGLRDLPGYNLKLGPGGIREIEFFAQTQQLALGGRDRRLRVRRTCDALDALAAAGRIDEVTATAMTADYEAHRRLEHRLQMIEDAQTHDIPISEDAREQVAALGGWPDPGAMEAEVAVRLAEVRARVERYFEPEAEDAPASGLDARFERPEMIAEMTDRWALGGIAATRDQRARRKIKALTPEILRRLSAARDPDEAAVQFDRFLSGLPAGVQLFSLFEANPQLLDLLSEICAAAPRLADYLSRNAGVIDAMLDADFFEPLPDSNVLTADLSRELSRVDDYETALNVARIWAKEHWFRLGVQVLRGVADGAEAGRGFTAIAEACLVALEPVVEDDFARRHGPPPGRGAAVIGMGKLGSREMTASSDLDLIIVYDAEGAVQSDGDKPLTIQQYFARLTQKLVSALTVLTAEGSLYEVDMRLRPSGGQGPVAVSLESFRNYQLNEAWTWEHMALTRARPVAGDAALVDHISAIIADALGVIRDPKKTRADVAEMRERVVSAHGGARAEPWALKHTGGGLMDVEFAVQYGLLLYPSPGEGAPASALPHLNAAGALSAADKDILAMAYAMATRLQHVERIAHAGAFRPAEAGEGLKAALARAGGAADFEALEHRLVSLQSRAEAIIDRLLA